MAILFLTEFVKMFQFLFLAAIFFVLLRYLGASDLMMRKYASLLNKIFLIFLLLIIFIAAIWWFDAS